MQRRKSNRPGRVAASEVVAVAAEEEAAAKSSKVAAVAKDPEAVAAVPSCKRDGPRKRKDHPGSSGSCRCRSSRWCR